MSLTVQSLDFSDVLTKLLIAVFGFVLLSIGYVAAGGSVVCLAIAALASNLSAGDFLGNITLACNEIFRFLTFMLITRIWRSALFWVRVKNCVGLLSNCLGNDFWNALGGHLLLLCQDMARLCWLNMSNVEGERCCYACRNNLFLLLINRKSKRLSLCYFFLHLNKSSTTGSAKRFLVPRAGSSENRDREHPKSM